MVLMKMALINYDKHISEKEENLAKVTKEDF